MPVLRIGGTERGEARAELRHADLEDVQHFERRESLARRRQLEYVVAVVIRRNRLGPLGLEFAEVRFRHHAAVRLLFGDDRIGNRAAVERVATLRLDQPQRFREARIPDDAVQRRRLAVDEEGLLRIGVGAQAGRGVLQIRLASLGEPPPFVGQPRRALERLLEAERPEPFQHRVVAGDRARHGRRIHAVVRHGLTPSFVLKKSGVQPAGAQPAELSA